MPRNNLERRLKRAQALLEALAVCSSPDDFAMVLVNKVFAPERLLYTYMFDTDGTTELRRIGGFGDPISNRLPERISIWENVTIAKSYRDDAFVRVESASHYGQVYDATYLPSAGQGVISMPLHEFGKTVGALVLVFEEPLSAHDFDDDEIRLVQLCGEHLMRDWRGRHHFGKEPVAFGVPNFTGRQVTVLEGMRSGMSLREIAVDLSVSLATVKVEAQKIYRLLGVHKKRDAIAVAERLGAFSDGAVNN